MLTWVSVLKYYENARGYNIVFRTFQNSSSIVLMAIVGILPVFIGFGVLGMCIFWRSKRFFGFGASMFSLFALMNGDMIFDSYHDLDTIDYILSQVYLYVFVSISIMVIQNVFIVIIEDGYMISKFRNKNDWLKLDNAFNTKTIQNQPPQMTEHARLHLHGTEYQNIPQVANTQQAEEEPTHENPFAKIYKKRKKDVKSRDTLVKMLWHEKITLGLEPGRSSEDSMYLLRYSVKIIRTFIMITKKLQSTGQPEHLTW